MKRIKHILAVVMASLLVLAMALPAMAAGTLTIKNTKSGEKYSLYKVLDATYGGDEKYHYMINSAFQNFFNAELGGTPTNEEVYTYISGLASDVNAKREFAKKLGVYALTPANGVVAVADSPYTATGESVTIPGLDYGYYLMIPDVDSTDGSVIFSLNTLGDSVDIENKTTYPTIDKEVKGPNDNHYGTTTVAAVGDVLSFELESVVPRMNGYDSYSFIFHDTLQHMSVIDDPSDDDYSYTLVIGPDGSTPLVLNVDYTVTVSADKKHLDVEILNFINFKGNVGNPIKFTYNARVDADAVIGGTGNDNTAYIEYSNNPTKSSDTKETPPDTTKTYTLELTLHKVDDKSEANPLTGSKWQLVKDLGAGGTKDYGEIDGSTGTGLSDFTWKNIGPGHYFLYETKAPDGYIPISLTNPIEITVSTDGTVTAENKLTNLSLTVEGHSHFVDGSATANAADGKMELTVKNSTQSLLPTTGGAGLYVVAAVALLALLGFGGTAFLKRKLNGED